MQLVKFLDGPGSQPSIGLLDGDSVRPLRGSRRLSTFLHAADPAAEVHRRLDPAADPLPLHAAMLLPPIDDQEVWAAGVTYIRSKQARQAESETGGSFYDLVYSADRPELFFKATASRVVGPGDVIRVRSDTSWSVPEPELALVIDDTLRLVGLTIGNDVSARDIEGRNPLYLPQAKVYDASCALGPAVTLLSAVPDPANLTIALEILRDGSPAFQGETSSSRLARRLDELISWLGRDQVFPDGVILMTGTGIVPPDEFTLQPGDVVRIAIAGLGVLENVVAPR
ncbi:fumarylacetoacetate hydrolase family protein [Tautonia sociabilis]|uniref:2-hydroxyhepta-2,4-diene-1,7-dioate isomerase n=1 Tax=Tautonia sociabilis TaxID=2080755 RepID=A0A432MG95_9BACT|nr:fumarylacetoacetate hydrolase family protein [Tautonia sociabilis]RUL85614.1 2-hydroxyhepta-2,4-diene-1,7-dioate isomerase [Tautonia sociabilis]